ncbi:septation protein SepH [Pedococcus sp. 5OH_020]|uniref:septation protein SepH n=1 Tax=Pedococcus sp. 5OH_020 TaxID=2989814 RepID=UPI0022EA08A3|nr:septation protein SepH [Pedococcus sp. 5OH_020]
MRDLRLIGVHEDGQHLLMSDSAGERFRVPLDEPLRAAVRRDRPRLGQLQIEIDGGMRPREVQALIRAGLSSEEVADRAGWSVDKVRRYEGPILAEREYVAGLARAVRLRGRGGGAGGAPTLAARVSQRLSARGVDPAMAEWDSARAEGGDWTVVLTFPAGGRERQARWAFDTAARTVVASDDEARWLSEDDSSGVGSPLPAPHLVSTPVRATTVYDVEAEGGLRGPGGRPAGPQRPQEPVDLMSAMRERASHRGRPRRRKSPAAQTPLDEAPREDALPLEDLHYDPETMAPPPAARGTHPLDLEDTPEANADAPDPVGDDVLPGPETGEVPAPLSTEPTVLPDLRDAERTLMPDVQDVQPTEVPHTEEAAKAPDAPSRAAPEGASDAPSFGGMDDDDTVGDAEEESSVPPPERSQAGRDSLRPAKKNGRRSVPSWDDVMFGAKPRD